MEEKGERSFRGFTDDDEVRVTIVSKKERINVAVRRLTGEEQHPSPNVVSDEETTPRKKPVNRFLRRSESSPSPQPHFRGSIITSQMKRCFPSTLSAAISKQTNTYITSHSSPIVPSHIPRESVVRDDFSSKQNIRVRCLKTEPVLTTTGKESLKLLNATDLKVSASNSSSSIFVPSKVRPQLIRMIPSQPSVPVIETGASAVEIETEHFNEMNVDINYVVEATTDELVEITGQEGTSKTDNFGNQHKVRLQKKELPPLERIPSPKSKENGLNKGISSSVNDIQECEYTRPRRPKAPNPRFISDDYPPSNSSKAFSSQMSPKTKIKSSASSPVANPKSNKKRSISQSENVTANRKPTQPKSESGVIPAKSSCKAIVNVQMNFTANTPDVNSSDLKDMARPRRTIIPNRKFISEDEPIKDIQFLKKKTDPVAHKKTSDIDTTKRKRQKSRKLDPSAVDKNLKKEKKFVTTSELEIVPAVIDVAVSATSSKDGKVVEFEAEQNDNRQGATDIINGSNTVEIKHKLEKDLAPSLNVQLDVDETEMRLIKGNPKFLGTCVLKCNNGVKEDIEGTICCGVCGQIKKYKVFSEQKRRESYLCTECAVVVDKIFQFALEAKPFTCIFGPPVCSGWCPLTHSPGDQFCEACFAKACLQNLPLQYDIYFKIWRSIPPMSRGCVSTVPVVNHSSPYVGKIVYINDAGDIISTKDSLENGAINDEDIAIKSNGSMDNFLGNTEDLNSARIIAVQRTKTEASSNNCENLIPLKMEEPMSSASFSVAKLNGVSKEEILLGRQNGLERVETFVDPIFKPEVNDIERFGFAVVVSGPSYPRKPLCFLCGSSGIEQLIFCSMCCEPYHPYCSGDDLLLDAYIARYNGESDERKCSKEVAADNSKLVLKWTCRQCIACQTCGNTVGSKEFIRCNRCHNPFHLSTCVDKQILSKIKNLDKLKKVWVCDTCLNCKSCGKKIESNRRVHTIQQAAAAENLDTEGEDVKEKDESSSNCSSQSSCLMLCLECFKQRKKGSFCPLCEMCYDDNDWDSKMMECSVCNRWIHSTCEDLNDDQYNVLGRLPQYIDFVCRLCHKAGTPSLWRDAVQSQLIKECASALRLFENKSIGSLRWRRKRSSVSMDEEKPSFVRILFGDEPSSNIEAKLVTIDERDAMGKTKVEEIPRLRLNVRKTVSFKELTSCKVNLRDFVKYPKNIQENLQALKILGVEVLNEVKDLQEENSSKMPATPIFNTPTKFCYTPTKHVTTITDSIKTFIGTIKSLNNFKRMLLNEIERTCSTYEEANILIKHMTEAIEETFPWFNQQLDEPEPSIADSEASTDAPEDTSDLDDEPVENMLTVTSDPFKEVYWNPTSFFDDRECVLCGEVGDFPEELCGRLLWCGVNEWIHCNCAIWSSEVWEHEDGALQQIGGALNRGKNHRCKVCGKKGATVSCCHTSCKCSYHFLCALNAGCYLLEDKTMFCSTHNLKPDKLESIQHDMKVGRKVFVDLDWIYKKGIKASSNDIKVFVGSLEIVSFGSIVPMSVEQINWDDSFTLLIPKNFKAHRIFWCMEHPWRKESYMFSTSIDSDIKNKVQDVAVNIVVDHESHFTQVKKGLVGIQKFHQWLQRVPKVTDEELIDWWAPSKELYAEAAALISSQIENVYDNYNPSRYITEDEAQSTEGYASSVDSYCRTETPKSSKVVQSRKRRRSNCKARKMPKRLCKTASSYKLESPRRKVLRNSQLKPRPEGKILEGRNSASYQEESYDSGVNESSSSSGSCCEGERIACRVNLMKQFNETLIESSETHTEALLMKSDLNVMNYTSGNVQTETINSWHTNVCRNCQSDDVVEEGETVKDDKKNTSKIHVTELKFHLTRSRNQVFTSNDIQSLWMPLFDAVSKSREKTNLNKISIPTLNWNRHDEHKDKANGFRMSGIIHRSVQYIVEQLSGILNVCDLHQFRYSHRPYVDYADADCPLPINQTGCSRSEAYTKTKPFDMFGWLASRHRRNRIKCNMPEDTFRGQQGLPIAMQYRDLGIKAKQKFVVLHSEIHGRGLFSKCDVEKGEMLIEYAGEVIRHSLTDLREKLYESKGIGCYMFRVKTQVIDATMKGNAARFINHSCEPNCEAKTIRIFGNDHIIIFALRKIFKGEELTYDYKFEKEDEKIPCTCRAAKCRKYMN